MTAQGRANYEAYRKASGGVSLISGATLPEYDRLVGDVRHAWDVAADVVERWLASAPVDEDAPGNEPEAAKVIIVVEAPVGDRGPVERKYAAPDFGTMRDGSLVVGKRLDGDDLKVDVCASYAPGAWLSVREDGASTGDPFFRQGKKLAVALDALRQIADDTDGDTGDGDLMARAQQALDDIAELDL